jgi:hypothetical protein
MNDVLNKKEGHTEKDEDDKSRTIFKQADKQIISALVLRAIHMIAAFGHIDAHGDPPFVKGGLARSGRLYQSAPVQQSYIITPNK